MIFEGLSVDELRNMTINANELFKCSAKLHFKDESDSNATIIENCFQKLYALKTFGD